MPAFLFVFFVAFSSSVWAETSQAAEVELQTGFSAIWKNNIGSGFRKGARDLGFALGPGLGLEIFGSDESHDLALAFGHYGWILSDLLAEGKLYQGNFEVRGNLFAGGQFDPHGRYVVGGEDVSMTMEVRGFHLSNASIEHPNHGTSTVMFLIGTSWFF